MKNRKDTPKMLANVVQAVTELKDTNGSTTKKIMDHVHTAMKVANLKSKPRNVVMQVKRALKHGVDAGVLKHKAGKYRLNLAIATKPKPRTRAAIRQHRRSRKRRRAPRRGRHRRRNLNQARSSSSATSTTIGSYGWQSRTADFSSSGSDREARSARRRHRSIAKRTVQISREATRNKPRRRMNRPRKPTPMPTKTADPDATSQELAKQIENLENVFAQNPPSEQIPDTFNNDTTEQLTIEELPSECCGNPDCLCNLKQEPSEEATCEEMAVSDNNGDYSNNNCSIKDDISDLQSI